MRLINSNDAKKDILDLIKQKKEEITITNANAMEKDVTAHPKAAMMIMMTGMKEMFAIDKALEEIAKAITNYFDYTDVGSN